MKIVITATGTDISSEIDARFGRCGYFVLIDTNSGKILNAVANEAQNAMGGAGPKAVQQVVDLGAEAVISGNFGPKAFDALKAADLGIYIGAAGTVSQTFNKYVRGELESPKAATVNR